MAVKSTDEAAARLADDGTFRLVISDWSRPDEGADAGLTLLRRMRASAHAQPVVYYHGEFNAAKRKARARLAQQAGAFGEAVLPDELLSLVVRALGA